MKFKILLLLIIVLAASLRLYRFEETLSLETDQAAAYLLADRIINDGHLLLVGPLTSIWQINLLSPTYYYLIAGLYYLFGNELTVSAIFAAGGILTVYLIYLLAEELWGKRPALLTAFFYSLSLTMTQYSRNIWEVHLVPLFVILALYLTQKAIKRSSFKLLLLSWPVFFFSLMYVSSILILPLMLFLWTKAYLAIRGGKRQNAFLQIIILTLSFGFIFYLPVIIFEATHGYPSLEYFLQVLGGRTPYIGLSSGNFIQPVISHMQLLSDSLFNFNLPVILMLPLWLSALFLSIKKSGRQVFDGRILSWMIITALVSTVIWQDKPEVYRLAALYPVIFLIWGFLSNRFTQPASPLHFKIVSILLMVIYAFSNLSGFSTIIKSADMSAFTSPFKTASLILKQAENKDFSVFVITPFERFNHHATSYYWALEKLAGKKLADLNDRGNWIDQNLQRTPWIFLICKEYQAETEASSDCLSYFLKEYRLPLPEVSIPEGDDFIYKIRGD